MWIIERNPTRHPITDEDRAMAYVLYGTQPDRTTARETLVVAVKNELYRFVLEPNDGCWDAYCISRLAYLVESLLQHPEIDSVEHEGLQFSIREFLDERSDSDV